mmetsp:Transcript_34082/g.95853  ORF Transcript_34082/g.95853 Transcript_34082/m.95853 type:complete len:317 (+) Transcript_34082:100-1050(+)
MSKKSQGFLIRCVGRNRITDGWLETLISVLCPPLFLYNVCRARWVRDSWREVLFQLFSVGSDPAAQHPAGARSCGGEGGALKFVCISDTHNLHERLAPLPPGDVLVHTGDFTNHGSIEEVRAFASWFGAQPHGVKIVVPGNHDMIMDDEYYSSYYADWAAKYTPTSEALACFEAAGVTVLMDALTVVGGVRVFGSPWVTKYAPWSTAFNKSEDQIKSQWETVLPPAGSVDVLLTHSPPHGFCDREPSGCRAGCPHLALAIARSIRPQVHVFGHVHSDAGAVENDGILYVNAASVCNYYVVGGRRPFEFSIAPRAQS